jgi:hypothetical protein
MGPRRVRGWLLVACTGLPLFVGAACTKNEPLPKSADPMGSGASAASVGTTMTPCTDAPLNPAEAMAKEPGVMNACLASAAKGGVAAPCGNAKIAVEIGKDGKVIRADVADSTLPPGVTDCLKARLAAMQYACPKEGSATYTVPIGLPTGGVGGGCPGLPSVPAPTTGAPPASPPASLTYGP